MTSLSEFLHIFKKYSADTLSPFYFRRAIAKLYLCTIILAISCIPFSAFSADGIIDIGGFETGDFSQWRGLQGHANDRQFQIITSPVRQGKYAARFEVRDGDDFMQTSGERAILSSLDDGIDNGRHTTVNEEHPGDDYYYAWSTLFADLDSYEKWRPVFMQWHNIYGGIRSPVLFSIDTESMGIVLHLLGGRCQASDCSDNVRKHKIVDNATNSKWNDFVVHAKWTCENDGFIEVWHKYANEDSYTKVFSKHNISTLQYFTTPNHCIGVYKVLGWYRSSEETGTDVLYYDGFTQGTSFEAVTKHAHNTIATQSNAPPPPSNLKVVSITSGDIENGDIENTGGVIPRGDWRLVYVDSVEQISSGGLGIYAFDGEPSTHWHTQWKSGDPAHPHEIQIDLGAEYKLKGFTYLPRQDKHPNGRIKEYAFYVSSDGSTWGNPVASGTFSDNAAEKEIIFNTPVVGRFIRLVALSEVNGNPWTSVAEINVLGNILNQ